MIEDLIQVVQRDDRWFIRIEHSRGVSYLGPYEREVAEARCAQIRAQAVREDV